VIVMSPSVDRLLVAYQYATPYPEPGAPPLLERVIDVLAENEQRQPAVASVVAGLRVLAQVGDPRDDAAAGLITAGQADRLQQLPASAVIITYAGPAGRQVVMADANPGIGGLGAATPLTLEEFRARPAAAARTSAGAGTAHEPVRGNPPPGAVSWRSGQDRPPPNLGPPPARLDWRRRRS